MLSPFEDYAPPATGKTVEAEDPADQAELVPYLAFISILNFLAPFAASVGDSYDTFAVEGPADQGSSSTARAADSDDDEDRAVMRPPLLAFKAVADAVADQDPDEPFLYGAPPTPGPAKGSSTSGVAVSVAPFLEGLDDDAEAGLLPSPFLAFAAVAHLLFYGPETRLTGAPRTTGVDGAYESLRAFLSLPAHAVAFALAPFNMSRKGATLTKKTKKDLASQSHEDLASLAGQKFFGGGKKQSKRTVRLRTAL